MTRMSFAVAAALISAAAFTSTGARAQFSEPAAYQAQHPDRDVLNGGQLTPAGRAAHGFPPAPSDAFASERTPMGTVPVVHMRRHRQQR